MNMKLDPFFRLEVDKSGANFQNLVCEGKGPGPRAEHPCSKTDVVTPSPGIYCTGTLLLDLLPVR